MRVGGGRKVKGEGRDSTRMWHVCVGVCHSKENSQVKRL